VRLILYDGRKIGEEHGCPEIGSLYQLGNHLFEVTDVLTGTVRVKLRTPVGVDDPTPPTGIRLPEGRL